MVADSSKTPIPDGRKMLIQAGFSASGVNAGARCELWFSPNGAPVTIAYAAPYGQFYDTESLDKVLVIP